MGQEEINKCLDELARLTKLGKINNKYYIGQNGTIFLRTKFGYTIASILHDDYPEGDVNQYKVK